MTSSRLQGEPRVLIVAEHASARFGGEAILPLHYFVRLRAKGIETWMIVHERTRSELTELLGPDIERVTFISDRSLHRLMNWASRFFPDQLSYITFGYISRVSSQLEARRRARTLVEQHAIDVVHQPIPVSPREPSLLSNLGAALIVGPLNGGMEFPDGFRIRSHRGTVAAALVQLARGCSDSLHWLFPGKLNATVILVANDRTRAALPRGCKSRVELLIENGVDVRLWRPRRATFIQSERDVTRFVFAGRLVDWKRVDLLVEAFWRAKCVRPCSLTIIGDGPKRAELEHQVEQLGLADSAFFLGWLTQEESARVFACSDVFVLPSIFEAGGAVVLEAMACGLPVVATKWGGPIDYVDPSCGVLVEPRSANFLVEGISRAMIELAAAPEIRERMGAAGRHKVETTSLNWDTKIDKILQVYDDSRELTRILRSATMPD